MAETPEQIPSQLFEQVQQSPGLTTDERLTLIEEHLRWISEQLEASFMPLPREMRDPNILASPIFTDDMFAKPTLWQRFKFWLEDRRERRQLKKVEAAKKVLQLAGEIDGYEDDDPDLERGVFAQRTL